MKTTPPDFDIVQALRDSFSAGESDSIASEALHESAVRHVDEFFPFLADQADDDEQKAQLIEAFKDGFMGHKAERHFPDRIPPETVLLSKADRLLHSFLLDESLGSELREEVNVLRTAISEHFKLEGE